MDNPAQWPTIKTWLEVLTEQDAALDGRKRNAQRLKRLHGLQIAQDVLAHAENIPLCLLRTDNLENLGNVFNTFVRKWRPEVEQILMDVGQRHPRLKKSSPLEAAAKVDALLNPVYVERLRDWVLSMATTEPEPRPDIPASFETWFMELLPHLERDIWLTEMSNPHPAHSLARMVEHWSLFEVMWAWKNLRPSVDDKHKVIEEAFGVSRLGLVLIPAFQRGGRNHATESEGDRISLLLGPFELEPADSSPVEVDTEGTRTSWFDRPFRTFLDQVARIAEVWWDVEEKAPDRTELLDAFATRTPVSFEEAEQSAYHCVGALRALLQAELHPSLFAGADDQRPLSRANWETAATLCTWFHRWRGVLGTSGEGRTYHFGIAGHRVVMEYGALGSNCAKPSRMVLKDARSPMAIDVCEGRALVQRCIARSMESGLWIETPEDILASARERQHALWTSQALAIQSLMTRHSRHDRPIGHDQYPDGSAEPDCDEVDFMLHGYGSKVCQYLLQIARAEVACIMWLDYSTSQLRVRHVGGADRLVQHRAQRRERFKTFVEWAHAPGKDLHHATPAEAGENSPSQIYRSFSAAEIEPHSRKFKVSHADNRAWLRAESDHFASPRPEDSIAVPLLFNGRVVGAFYIAGIASSRQFDDRLDAPLRQMAQLLAQEMASQAQLWQMRRLNWLAAHRPPDLWRHHDVQNQFNPLEPVARILANIFLCPVVNIWLRDAQNPKRYKLHGYTHPKLFASHGKPLDGAPQFRVQAVAAPDETVPIERQFIFFACDQWLHAEGRAEAGAYIQARFQEDVKTSENYTASRAGRGALRLGLDFVQANEQSGLYRALFVDGQLHQIAALALVDTSTTRPEPVGIVSLHAPVPTRGGHHLPWPPGWRQVIGHMQTYIPYVLAQSEVIANPLQNLRGYLLHEGRSEFNMLAAYGNQVRGALLHLLSPDETQGKARSWLRRTTKEILGQVKSMRGSPDASWLITMAHDLERIEKQLAAAWLETEWISNSRHAENLLSLARLFTHHRDFAALGAASANMLYDHETEWLPVRELIGRALHAYDRTWRDEEISIDLTGLPQDLRLLCCRSLFEWMLRDLVHNFAKYALRHEPIMVSWHWGGSHEDRTILRLSNLSTFDPDLDQKDRLVLFGVQGSAVLNSPREPSQRAGVAQQGQGIGLWGVSILANVLDMPLDLTITPRRDGHIAHYQFDFKVPRRIVGSSI